MKILKKIPRSRKTPIIEVEMAGDNDWLIYLHTKNLTVLFEPIYNNKELALDLAKRIAEGINADIVEEK